MENYKDPLDNSYTFALFNNEELIFHSNGNWLHPLFQAEEFLKTYKGDKSNLKAHDRISGRAAASLTIFLDIKAIHVDLIGRGALSLYEKHNVECTYDKIIDKIQCITEDLVKDDMSIASTYQFLRRKANLTKGLSLQVKDLSFSYAEKPVLDNISFSILPGEAIILSGENGEGKTTLIKIILGLLKQKKGEILFDGKEKRENICYIKQTEDIKDFPFSVREVVSIGLKENEEESIELSLRRVGIYHLIDREYCTLSGGEKQKVNLARALASKSKLLILDEPTASMDKKSKNEFVKLLSGLTFNEMPTILLVSHDEEVKTELNWKNITLSGGKIV